MRNARSILLAACALAACEAVPDEDSLDKLRDSVASIPIEAQGIFDKWAANRVAFGYLLNYDSDQLLGTITCKNGPKETDIDVSVQQVIRCLSSYRTAVYKDCLASVLDDVHDEYMDDECKWKSFERPFDPAYTPYEFESERVGLKERVASLLGDPPPMEVQLLLIKMGMMGPAGVLCPLSTWACPENPFGGSTVTTSTGGGDR